MDICLQGVPGGDDVAVLYADLTGCVAPACAYDDSMIPSSRDIAALNQARAIEAQGLPEAARKALFTHSMPTGEHHKWRAFGVQTHRTKQYSTVDVRYYHSRSESFGSSHRTS